MGIGSYAGFETLDIISNFENSYGKINPVQILVKMANESFKAESAFYKQIGLDEYCSSAGAVTSLLKEKMTFDKYQQDLSEKVYGFRHKEETFIKYFYDSNFIKSLSASSSGNNLLNNLAKELREYYISTKQTTNTIVQNEKEEGAIETVELKDDFFNELKEKTHDFSDLTEKEVEKAVILYVLEKTNATNNAATKGAIKKQYKEVIAQIKNFVKNKSKDIVTTSGKKKGGGQGFLQLAELHFMDNGKITIDDQLNKMVNKIMQFLIDKIGTDSFDLRSAIQNEVFNNLQYEIGLSLSSGERREIIHDKQTYVFSRAATKSSGNSTIFKKSNQMFTLTYPEIKKLAQDENAQFKLSEIQLLGGEDNNKKIFTPEIKHQITQLLANSNPSTTITDSDLEKMEIVINDAYIDKNSFFKEMSKLNFNYLKYSDEKISLTDSFKNDINTISEIFYNVIYNALGNPVIIKGNEIQIVQEGFSQWWQQKGLNSFYKMIENNPAQIYEIVSKSSEANVAGMLGETLMALFLTNLDINSSLVKVLGQTTHGNGQAAVDLKILFPENEKILRAVGFQIKQYASKESSGKTDLYDNTTLLLSSEYMRRYLETKYLEQIRSIFFDKDNEKFWLKPQDIQDNQINLISNILNSHLIYFIRYDEAQMKGENIVSTEQNNFYIINFRFIPSSTLFILAAIALANQIKNKQKFAERYDFFYFTDSSEIMKTQNNIMSSLINYLNLETTKKASKENNLCNFMRDDLRLHFRGFKVNFSEQLDSVIKNAQR